MLSHTSVGFLVEICLSRSLLQWDMEKCGRYTKSQDTQCKAPTGHSGGHSVAQDVTRNLWTLSTDKYPNMGSFGPDSSPCKLRAKFHFLQLSSSTSARDRAFCRARLSLGQGYTCVRAGLSSPWHGQVAALS